MVWRIDSPVCRIWRRGAVSNVLCRPGPIWLFDGVCVLCSGAVRHVLKHERHGEMRFVAIQSGEGKTLARQYGIDPENPDSALAKSDGVLALLGHINGPARVLRVGRILPRFFRDWIYDRVARNRYSMFGKSAACMMPDRDLRERFVLPESAA
jgi:predicted DCC family thiol-disulfide oxidoreductase YuxK